MPPTGGVRLTQTIPPPGTPDTAEPLPCPLCDYDLRGLTEPRCPECGYTFEWRQMLDPALRRHEFLFEHHPRRSLWSFRRTLVGGLRPRRFWGSLFPSQPSKPRRLVLYWLLAAVVLAFTAAIPLAVAAAQFVNSQREYRLALIAYYSQPSFDRDARLAWGIQTYGSLEAYIVAIHPINARTVAAAVLDAAGPVTALLSVLAFWPWLTFLALMVFRISMRRAKVKPAHVLRCVIYSYDALFWLGALSLLLGPVAAGLMLLPVPTLKVAVPVAVGLMYFAALLYMAYRLTVAYRIYLQFHRPAATVAAAQIIVALAVFTAFVSIVG